MRSPRYRSDKDSDDRREVQPETAQPQRRYHVPQRPQYRVRHRPHRAGDRRNEAARRQEQVQVVDQDRQQNGAEQYVVRVQHERRQQPGHAEPEQLQRQPPPYSASLLACSVAASMPSYTAATNPAFSIATTAAAVVPPGVMTSSRIWCAALSWSRTAVPPIVPFTSLRATSRGMPSLTPACTNASAKSATYAGPDPCSAVAASKSRSGSSITSPTCRKMPTTSGR